MSLLKALKNKMGSKISYKAPAQKPSLTDEQIRKTRNTRRTPTNSIPQYGDKNYKPSTGKGVGY